MAGFLIRLISTDQLMNPPNIKIVLNLDQLITKCHLAKNRGTWHKLPAQYKVYKSKLQSFEKKCMYR